MITGFLDRTQNTPASVTVNSSLVTSIQFARLSGEGVNFRQMKLFGKLAAVAMLLLLTGLPAMACAVPAAQMTEAERACCREMADQCGDMGGPSGHSCCQTAVQPPQAALLRHVAPSDHSTVAVVLTTSVHEVAIVLPATLNKSPLSWRHPPPALFVLPTILRI